MLMHRYRTSTAIAAIFALSLPHTAFPQDAPPMGEDMMLMCLDGTEPPCPDEEFEEGIPRPIDEMGVPIVEVLDEAELEEMLQGIREMRADMEPVGDPDDIPDVEVADPDIAADVEPQVEPAEIDADPEADPAELQEELEAEEMIEDEALADPPVAPAEAELDAEIDVEALDEETDVDVDAEADVPEPEVEAEVEPEVAAEDEVEPTAIDPDEMEVIDEPAIDEIEEVDPADPVEPDPGIDPETEAELDAEPVEPTVEDEVADVDPAEVPEAEGVIEAEAVAAATDDAAEPMSVVEDTLDEAQTRSSDEEFADTVDGVEILADPTAPERDGGLTNFQRALLLGLGAVAVGSLLDDGSQVRTSSGDRVVVERDGQLTVYKDDDAMLFRPGSNVRTETFADGSTRSFISRADGSQIVTIRDNQGRVLRRTRIAPDGTELRLFDDTLQYEPVNIADLAAARAEPRVLDFSATDEQALREALAAEAAYDAGRYFSLRQIRTNEEVRALVPSIDLDTINFATASAAIPEGQARDLLRLGTAIEDLLTENPREIFLIEGHTDAVGDPAYNLALSDRRAESVALALTEYFDIPPENLVVQGYGEEFLRIDTPDAEQANRRAVVRRITPLLQAAAAN